MKPVHSLFHLLIHSHRERPTHILTCQITKEIYESLNQTCRFLKFNREESVWEEISPEAARDKCGHALRFANRTKRNKKTGMPVDTDPAPASMEPLSPLLSAAMTTTAAAASAAESRDPPTSSSTTGFTQQQQQQISSIWASLLQQQQQATSSSTVNAAVPTTTTPFPSESFSAATGLPCDTANHMDNIITTTLTSEQQQLMSLWNRVGQDLQKQLTVRKQQAEAVAQHRRKSTLEDLCAILAASEPRR